MLNSVNSFGARGTLVVDSKAYEIYRLSTLENAGIGHVAELPFATKILLENLLRREDNGFVKKQDIDAIARWDPKKKPDKEIAFTPARVLMQDFTGVPAVLDLAAMREAIVELGGKPQKINPLVPADLVIDHSIQVDQFGSLGAIRFNTDREYERNRERYAFLRWGQTAFQNFRVVRRSASQRWR